MDRVFFRCTTYTAQSSRFLLKVPFHLARVHFYEYELLLHIASSVGIELTELREWQRGECNRQTSVWLCVFSSHHIFYFVVLVLTFHFRDAKGNYTHVSYILVHWCAMCRVCVCDVMCCNSTFLGAQLSGRDKIKPFSFEMERMKRAATQYGIHKTFRNVRILSFLLVVSSPFVASAAAAFVGMCRSKWKTACDLSYFIGNFAFFATEKMRNLPSLENSAPYRNCCLFSPIPVRSCILFAAHTDSFANSKIVKR